MRPPVPFGMQYVAGLRRELSDFTATVSLNGKPAFIKVPKDMAVEKVNWRPLVDLVVEVEADESVPLSRLLTTLDCIAKARPRYLSLRFLRKGEEHQIEVGDGFHMQRVKDIPAIHRFTWFPVNVSGTPAGRKLRQSLLKHREAFTVL